MEISEVESTSVAIANQERILESAMSLLIDNRRTRAGCTFTVPSPYEYRHQWLWDSCFHSIVLRHFDTEAAENELRSLLSTQRHSGMVPHESNTEAFGIRLPFKSRITQPPFIARAALDVYEKSGNKEFLQEIFPKLHAYHIWLEKQRVESGVINVLDSNESGEDNSILWDYEYRVPVHKTYLRWLSSYLPFYPQKSAIKSVNSTSVYADALECMSAISKRLKMTDLERMYSAKKGSVISAMRKAFRNYDGIYYNLTHKGKMILNKTHSIFSPMFCGAIEKKQARKIVDEHFFNKDEFWTKFPIPTVAKKDAKFSPTDYWRGPTRININWMTNKGLLKYGFKDAAADLLGRTAALVMKSGFREYYNPLTGDGLGAKQFGWSTLVADMIMA